jgi:hypothetical protein
MKRQIIFLGVLILLLAAAGDGFVGNYKSVAPDYFLTSVATNHRSDQQPSKSEFGRRILTIALLVPYLLQMSRHSSYQSLTAEVPHPGKITLCSHLCSSGGLPL